MFEKQLEINTFSDESDQNKLKPSPPFLWPEPRVFENSIDYCQRPPFHHLLESAQSICGVVSELHGEGLHWFIRLMQEQTQIQAKIILILYPACATKLDDLKKLENISKEMRIRLEIRLHFLEYIEDLPFQSLLVMPKDERPLIIFGPSHNFGFDKKRPDRVNFSMPVDATVMESWTRWFNWFWAKKSWQLRSNMVTIPDLVRPTGTIEGELMWAKYTRICTEQELSPVMIKIDPDTGDVVAEVSSEKLEGKNEEEQKQLIAEAQKKLPSVAINIPKLNPLADEIGRLFLLGDLAMIDKTTKIKPLSAPISPSLFGQEAQLRAGRIERKTSYKIDIFDETNQKHIDNIKNSIRDVMNAFSYPLADGARWVPHTAKNLLQKEIERRNKEGSELLHALVKDGVKAFLDRIDENIVRDANHMYQEFFPKQSLPVEILNKIRQEVKIRLESGLQGNILPKISYTSVGFKAPIDSKDISAWGTAYSLVFSLARYPIDIAASGKFFERNFKEVEIREVFKAMNVLNDPRLINPLHLPSWKYAKDNMLPVFSQLEDADKSTEDKCIILLKLIKTGNWEEFSSSVASNNN